MVANCYKFFYKIPFDSPNREHNKVSPQ